MWKRTVNSLYTWWGIRRGDVGAYSRPEFTHDTRIPANIVKFIHGEKAEVADSFHRCSVIILQIPVTLCLLGIVLGAWLLAIHLQNLYPAEGPTFSYNRIRRYTVSTIHAVTITIANTVYNAVATRFTVWENHRQDGGYETSLAVKTFIFSFFNSYLSLFWWAFIDPDQHRLVAQLINLVVVKQISDLLLLQLFPRLKFHFQLWRRGMKAPCYHSIVSRARMPEHKMTKLEQQQIYREVKIDYIRRLEGFYSRYKPAKVSSVPALVKKHFDQLQDMEILLIKIAEKYGAEVSPSVLSQDKFKIASSYIASLSPHKSRNNRVKPTTLLTYVRKLEFNVA